jgi:hypothetical protein
MHDVTLYKMTAAKLRLAMAAMGQPETKVGECCRLLVCGMHAERSKTCTGEDARSCSGMLALLISFLA